MKITKVNNILVVELNCDIDHHNATKIREKVDYEFKINGSKNIIFDFKNVNFMDSSGIGMLMGRYKIANFKGGNVLTINIDNNIKQIFDMSGITKIIKNFDDIDMAFEFILNGGNN